ncbi:MAG: NlpC/P60 family protein [Oscillospiraceae bacterium]|nr:NlpC/P60 family protein [Oscillospiraceae bacterium]
MSIRKRIVAPAAFVLAALVAAAAVLMTTFTTACAVYVDGEEWGIVESWEDAATAVESAENRAAEVLGTDSYELECEVTTEDVFVLGSDVTGDPEELEQELFDSVPEIVESYALIVDGEPVGIGTEEELQEMLDSAVDGYVTDNTFSVEVLSDTEIVYEAVPAATESESWAILNTLNTVVEDEITCQVDSETTVGSVAESCDVPVEQVIALNPDLSTLMETEDVSSNQETGEVPETAEAEETADEADPAGIPLEEGTVLTVEPETVLLSVETVDVEVHEEAVAYETSEIEDETLAAGERQVLTEGEDGSILIYESVTRLNGTETRRVQSDSILTQMPVTEVVAVGTMEETDETPADAEEETAAQQETEAAEQAAVEETQEQAPAEQQQEAAVTDSGSGQTDGTAQQQAEPAQDSSAEQTPQVERQVSSVAISSDTAVVQQETSSASTTQTQSSSSSADELRNQVVAYAKQFLGCPYAYGGTGPYSFDCSGLTYYVYAHFGISLSRTVTGQYAQGTYVPLDVSQMLPGDLIFWSYGGSTPTHVGMYIGNGQYIQATKPGDVVRINTVASYSGQPLVGCRRIIN